MKRMTMIAALVLLALSAFAADQQGVVETVNGDSFTLKVADGKTMKVQVAKSTSFAQADGSVAKRADLAAGKRVTATIAKDGKTATAVRFAAANTEPKVVLVESKAVCMINDRSMAMEQIPVVIDGKTYFGCCPMCKERLEKDEASRYAVDPVSGKKVDKAKAVIGALPGAMVVYFENAANLELYNAGVRAQ